MRPSEAESTNGIENGAFGSLAHSTPSVSDVARIARGVASRSAADWVPPMDASAARVGVTASRLPRGTLGGGQAPPGLRGG